MNNAMHLYKQIDTFGNAENANRVKLIEMLLTGAIDALVEAKVKVSLKLTSDKCSAISKAVTIIDGLQISLDKDAGGEVAENLEKLYEYMQFRLVEANLHDDVEKLDEVISLIKMIREAWVLIPEETIRNMSHQ